jgi:hypothetical protein
MTAAAGAAGLGALSRSPICMTIVVQTFPGEEPTTVDDPYRDAKDG